jgi:hypothetical protein
MHRQHNAETKSALNSPRGLGTLHDFEPGGGLQCQRYRLKNASVTSTGALNSMGKTRFADAPACQ